MSLRGSARVSVPVVLSDRSIISSFTVNDAREGNNDNDTIPKDERKFT